MASLVHSYPQALRAAVSKAFQTPEVIRMFANKNNGQLRQRLDQLQRDVTLGKLSEAAIIQQKVEILSALKKLGDEVCFSPRSLGPYFFQLKDQEKAFLAAHQSDDLKAFESATSDIGTTSFLPQGQKTLSSHF